MSLLEPTTDRLDDIASEIRAEIREGKAAANMALDVQLAIGRSLIEARELLPSDNDYGAWFASCEFGFSTEWGRTLRVAAGNEDAIRRAVATQVATGDAPNIKKAIESVVRKRDAIETRASKVEKKQIGSAGDGASSDASETVLEADATSDSQGIEDTLPGDGVSGSDESAGGDAPDREAGDSSVAGAPSPPPHVIDDTSTGVEKDAAKAVVFEQDPHGPADVEGDLSEDELSGSVGTALDETSQQEAVPEPEQASTPPADAGSGYGNSEVGTAAHRETKSKPKIDAVGIGRSVFAWVDCGGIDTNVDHLAGALRTLPMDERWLLKDRVTHARELLDALAFTLNQLEKDGEL